jgi:hypothetical protein
MSWFEELTSGGSRKEILLLLLLIGVAVLFVGYLVFDAVYHRRKWRRLKAKYRENAILANEQQAINAPGAGAAVGQKVDSATEEAGQDPKEIVGGARDPARRPV